MHAKECPQLQFHIKVGQITVHVLHFYVYPNVHRHHIEYIILMFQPLGTAIL